MSDWGVKGGYIQTSTVWSPSTSELLIICRHHRQGRGRDLWLIHSDMLFMGG